MNSRWVYFGFALLILGAGIWLGNACTRSHYGPLVLAEREARLKAEGLLVIEQRNEDDVRGFADSLASQLADSEQALEDAKLKLAAALRTGSQIVAPVASPPSSGAAGGGVVAGPASPPPSCPEPGCELCTRPPHSLLPGDYAEIGVDLAAWEERAGAQVLVGEAWLDRTKPEPRERLFSAPIAADASRVMVTESTPKRASRWGFGPAVGVAEGEWIYGAAVSAPDLKLGRLEIRPVGALLAGGGQEVAVGLATFKF